jgi:Pyridoxamine 5'-phosphate oxidase
VREGPGTPNQQQQGTDPMRSSDQQVRTLTRQEALDKLGSVTVGRVLFTRRWLPAVQFVNHILDNGEVIIHASGAEIAASGTGENALGVAYQADAIDPATRTGWSVTVTGPATLVTDAREAARYRDILRPWITGGPNDIISIGLQDVTGYEITAAEKPSPRTMTAPHQWPPRRLG